MDSYSELFNDMEDIHNLYLPPNFDELFYNVFAIAGMASETKKMFKGSLLGSTKKTITYSMLMSCLLAVFFSFNALEHFLDQVF